MVFEQIIFQTTFGIRDPFMEKSILNFHFDYLNTSLIKTVSSPVQFSNTSVQYTFIFVALSGLTFGRAAVPLSWTTWQVLSTKTISQHMSARKTPRVGSTLTDTLIIMRTSRASHWSCYHTDRTSGYRLQLSTDLAPPTCDLIQVKVKIQSTGA